MKLCSCCKQNLDDTCFGFRVRRGRTELRNPCKRCHADREEIARSAGIRPENRDLQKRRNYQTHRRLTDLGYRLRGNLAARIVDAVKGVGKSKRTAILLGCSIPEFKVYLQAKFSPKISWENYGIYWEIDHIRPCASFDLTDPVQQKECFHFSNLQPLCKHANRKKSDKYEFAK